MKTVKKVNIDPVYVEYMPDVLEGGKLYTSKKYSIAIHSCPCGCGNRVVTPLDEIVTEFGKTVTEMPKNGWILTEKRNRITITPSIGNYGFPCKSHYIITNNIANFI